MLAQQASTSVVKLNTINKKKLPHLSFFVLIVVKTITITIYCSSNWVIIIYIYISIINEQKTKNSRRLLVRVVLLLRVVIISKTGITKKTKRTSY